MICPPILPPMQINITLVEDVSVVSAIEETESRVVNASHRDNRTKVEDQFWTSGMVELTNPTMQRRWMSYQCRIPLPEGTYHSSDERICFDDNTAVFSVKRIVRPGESAVVTCDIKADRERFGDFNHDGKVDGVDLGRLFEGWGVEWGPAELGLLLANWKA